MLSVSKVSQRSDLARPGLLRGGHLYFPVGHRVDSLRRLHYCVLHPGPWERLFSTVDHRVLPYLESIFSITSSIRLLELSNPNQPLSRRLRWKLLHLSPQHYCLAIWRKRQWKRWAASASSRSGVNLLSRYRQNFKRPYFFTENQFTEVENPMRRPCPTLEHPDHHRPRGSGVELPGAKLPGVTVDLIRQHHGTDLLRFFFHRAAENDKEEQVEEKDFCYPGPRPQTKEAGIIMPATRWRLGHSGLWLSLHRLGWNSSPVGSSRSGFQICQLMRAT